MLDFFKVQERYNKPGQVDIYPDFRICHSKDIMIRGKSFYAIWDEDAGLWSTDEYDVARIVDKALLGYYEDNKDRLSNSKVNIKYMTSFTSNSWKDFKKYMQSLADNGKQLDSKIIFANTEVEKKDYISKRLTYNLEKGTTDAWDTIIGTLYSEEERAKIEWSIGAIISGEAKSIQKFLVFYGDAGSGKSTILNIIQKLFDGYYAIFDAKALTSNNSAFSTEAFRGNPLVAIQHDGDLSRIEDNTKLNSIVSHEQIIINEKYKASYPQRANCFLYMASNKPVKITDGKSGIIRRLIDVRPSGNKIPVKEYNKLMADVNYELGAIAYKCLDIFNSMGKAYYSNYRPIDMMYKTDPFFNFVENSYPIFEEQDGVTLKQAYSMYKLYCDDTNAPSKLPMYKFREELKNYFDKFEDQAVVDDIHVRSYFSGFNKSKFNRKLDPITRSNKKILLELNSTKSLFDDICSECDAQYANNDRPEMKWDNVKTKLKDIDTTKTHYVKVPLNHIVIDFDIPDENGNKCLEKNLEAAAKWPKTYAELSKSGSGVHLHYIYDGDPTQLSRIFEEHIEIKVYSGKSSLRRRLSKCNDVDIAHISSGLPLKERRTSMLNDERVKSEKGIRALLEKNLRKECHPGTKPSIDFIYKILEDAYNDGIHYDVTDMRQKILVFANNSTNQSDYCIKLVNKMKFKSEDISKNEENYEKDVIIFYDVEVFPNLFLIVWKREGEDEKPVKMINPSPAAVEELVKYKLVGFNNRRYDNHMLYARIMGFNEEQIYNQSQKIINNSPNAFFGEAYNLSYADIYEFSSKKQSLKKFEIELGIHHQELGLPWDKPVPEDMWDKVADYCINDVVATEAVWNARKADFDARCILADISGLTVNDTTRMHATKIIFGNDKHPALEYTDLREMFPGYEFDHKTRTSTYRGEEVGEGGYVYSEPGMYGNVALLDIASMHPTSIDCLNLFGDYTDNFRDIKNARLYIKHKDFDKAADILDGKLRPYLNEEQAPQLAQAMKIIINSIYGFTTATFDNPFKDPRNIDNIVAKRGALFMINLKHEVQERGYTVAHIKTDSIKIPDATPEIISFVMEYGKQYGYSFEHEATYEKLCLVNDAVYIAKDASDGHWTATGTQFQVPYVFKILFSKEPLVFSDFCETKSVSSSLYLDMNEKLPEDEHKYIFVGKIGEFCPIKPGHGGGELFREKDGKYYAATGTKGYRWLESEVVKNVKTMGDIDDSYYKRLCDEAIETISQYGDFEWFVSDDKYVKPPFNGAKIV